MNPRAPRGEEQTRCELWPSFGADVSFCLASRGCVDEVWMPLVALLLGKVSVFSSFSFFYFVLAGVHSSWSQRGAEDDKRERGAEEDQGTKRKRVSRDKGKERVWSVWRVAMYK